MRLLHLYKKRRAIAEHIAQNASSYIGALIIAIPALLANLAIKWVGYEFSMNVGRMLGWLK